MTPGRPPRTHDQSSTRLRPRNAQLPYAEALQQMMTLVEPAIERFRALLEMAPDEDRDAVQILFDHEIAIQRFAERELAGDTETSLDPVRDVIQRARAALATTATT